MIKHGCNVSSLLVPLSVVIICHHRDVVHGSTNLGHLISSINDLLRGRNSSSQEKVLGLQSSTELLNPLGEGNILSLLALITVDLPALRVLPIQIQTIKVVLLKEANSMLNEGSPGRGAVNQTAVLVASTVIPPTESEKNLLSLSLESSNSLVEF